MNINTKKSRLSLATPICVLCLFIIGMYSQAAHSSPLIYTIQAGSFKDIETARKQYVATVNALAAEDLDYLRIEKIGRYYSVRLGKFPDRRSANKFHSTVKRHLAGSILMSAYIKQERIKTQYLSEPSTPDKEKEPDQLQNLKPAEPAKPLSRERKKKDTSSADHYSNGNKYMKEKRSLSAAEEYQRAITKDPDNPVLHYKLAQTLSKIGLADDAIKMMKKAIELSPRNNAGFRGELGKIYLSRGLPDKAKEQFLAALTSYPGLGDMYYYLGVTFLKEESYDKAWYAAKTARSLGYKPRDLINILSLLSKDPHDAPWEKDGDNMYMRYISVGTRKEAKDTLQKILDGGQVNSFIGPIDPKKIHPAIIDALQKQKVFADPAIVETEHGFHIIQRIPPLSIYSD